MIFILNHLKMLQLSKNGEHFYPERKLYTLSLSFGLDADFTKVFITSILLIISKTVSHTENSSL